MNVKSNNQLVFINILKSIACICVLVGHVLNGMIKDGMEIHLVLYHINTFVYLFHVPCFFFASGYLYGKNDIEGVGQYLRFIGKKFIVLGVPYLICSIAYILFSSVLSGDMHTSYSFSAIAFLWKEPVAQYWYLYALFEMFLIIPIIEFVFKNLNKFLILVLFTVAALLIYPDIDCVAYVTGYAYIFYMGVYFNKTDLLDRSGIMEKRTSYIFLCSCAGCIVIYGIYSQVISYETFNNGGILKSIVRPLLVLMIVGISLAIEKMKNCVNRFLIWLSQYSLYVYLFHTWFSGTLRVVLRRAGITNCWIQAVSGIAVGLSGSVLLAVIIRKVPLFRVWFEPLKVLERGETGKRIE